jgi:hypothetical protein
MLMGRWSWGGLAKLNKRSSRKCFREDLLLQLFILEEEVEILRLF